MLKTVLIIILSVTIFGIAFFIIVKRALKKQLNYYLRKEKKNNSNHFTKFCEFFFRYI